MTVMWALRLLPADKVCCMEKEEEGQVEQPWVKFRNSRALSVLGLPRQLPKLCRTRGCSWCLSECYQAFSSCAGLLHA